MPRSYDAGLKEGQNVAGFEIGRVTPLDELRAVAVEMRHARSGARLLHVRADDPENLFSVAMLTPPPDDTGLPHILEHAVLAGSRKFPVREPFFEMVKMSMATFINAMTGPDCTYYPVASNVPADLFNLADVYFDAVFHPLLSAPTFRREAHHLAPADPESPGGALVRNGVVFNEMKGAYSDPESLLHRYATQALLPDTIYSLDAGGDPDRIPDLTHDDLRRFHETFYHPANARFFFYGDIPTSAYLEFLAPRLEPFGPRAAAPEIRPPAPWSAPRSVARVYPVGADEDPREKTYLGLHWLTGDATSAPHALMQMIMGLILCGNEGAPLKKAVIESRLGADLIGAGSGAAGRLSTFSLDLRGSEADRADRFSALVLETLARAAAAPIDARRVEAAFQQAAYHYLEVAPMFPLHTMSRALHAWIYGGDPLEFLAMGRHLRACRERWERDPRLFNALIRESLLENTHRLACVLAPDRDLQARLDAASARALKAERDRLDAEQLAAVAAQSAELARLSTEPNPPEALAALPQLRVLDLPRSLTHVRTSVENAGGIEFLRNDVFANGISYLVLDLDLCGLPARLWPVLPRYVEAVERMGAAGHDFAEMAQRLASYTGGLDCHPRLTTHAADGGRSLWRLRFALKALDANMPRALELLRDILFRVDPRDAARLRDVIAEARAGYRSDLVYEGSHTAAQHASRGLTAEGHLTEILAGLPQLAICERLAARFDAEAAETMSGIEAVRDFLLARQRVSASFTGSDAACAAVRDALSAFAARMRDEAPAPAPTGFRPFAAPPREGLAAPIQVAHCVRVMPAPHFSHPDETLLTVGAHMVTMDCVMPAVRLKGNAYGAWFHYSPFGRTMSAGSYRDPRITETLAVFERLPDYVRDAAWTRADVDRAIIATAKRELRPIRPGAATAEALDRHHAGQTPELREARYEALRRADAPGIKRALLAALAAGERDAAVCVVAGRRALEDAGRRMSGGLEIADILPAAGAG
ncbi:MAG: hypothetical protein FJ225_08725 [Lentisphaerae bacterium]|nr:hypothetical protein [Lentisphaerota bacterium]